MEFIISDAEFERAQIRIGDMMQELYLICLDYGTVMEQVLEGIVPDQKIADSIVRTRAEAAKMATALKAVRQIFESEISLYIKDLNEIDSYLYE